MLDTGDDDSSATSSPAPTPRQLLPGKKKRRGARLSKQEREARQQQRLAASQGGAVPSEDCALGAFQERRARLLNHVERGEWNEAGALGGESVQLSEELLQKLLLLGRHRLTTHLATSVAATVPPTALAHLVHQALAAGHVAAAAALARGLGLSDGVDLVEAILQCYESGRVHEAAEAVGGDRALEMRTLHAMLRQSRALAYALQYAPTLRHLPTPDVASLAKIGADARALAASLAVAPAPASSSQGIGATGGRFGAAALAEAVRAHIEGALRASPTFADAHVHTFGSAALGLAANASDVDLCALLPSRRQAHCRDAPGRAKLAPVLTAAVEALRTCGAVSGVQLISEGRTPLVRFEYDADHGSDASNVTDGGGGGGCTSVELCFNNTDGLANTFVMRELLGVRVGGVDGGLHALAAVARLWSKRRGLAGTHNTLNSYSWTLMAAYSVQQHTEAMPVVAASSGAFAALLESPSAADSTSAQAWQRMARASLAPNSGGLDASLQAARMVDVESPTPPSLPLPTTSPTGPWPHPTPPQSVPTESAADAQVGLLVWHFFLLWATDFPYRRRVASLRSPHELTKSSKGWTRRDEQALMLEDPIEASRDLGRLVGRPPMHAMRLDACLALCTLSKGGSLIDDVCAPSDWRVREHARLFGADALRAHLNLPAAAQPMLVTSVAQLQTHVAPALAHARSVALDCEGEHLSRSGRLCVLQLCTDGGALFIIDVLSPDGAAMISQLKPALESTYLLKVLHDCRRDAEALLHQHGVRLSHVFDTQATYALLRSHTASERAAARAARAVNRGGGDPPSSVEHDGEAFVAEGEPMLESTTPAGTPSQPPPQLPPLASSTAVMVISTGAARPTRATREKQKKKVAKEARAQTECAPLGHLVRRFVAGGGAAAKENVGAQMSADASYWARRPLLASQVRYAAADVAVLLPLHRRLVLEMAVVEIQARRRAAAETAAGSMASHDDAGAASELLSGGGALLAAAMERSRAQLSVRDHAFGVTTADELRLHMVLPGLVSNISGYGIFVQIADGLVGLVGLPELLGAPAPDPHAICDTWATVPPSRDVASALSAYRVADALSVRVISLRTANGQRLVGLSLHASRLNPGLDQPSQLIPSDGLFWARVLLVTDERATVSLELPAPCELPRALAFAPPPVATGGGGGAGTRVALDSPDLLTPTSLRDALSIGMLVRVRAAPANGPSLASLADGAAPDGMSPTGNGEAALRTRVISRLPHPMATSGSMVEDRAGGDRSGGGEKRAWESASEADSGEEEEDEEGEEEAVDDEGRHAAKRRRVDPFLSMGL